MRRAALSLLVLGLFATAATAADEWAIGLTVFPRAEKVTARGADKEKTTGTWDMTAATVLRESGEWIEVQFAVVNAGTARGWVKKAEAVKLGDAVAFYSDALKTAPNSAWAFRHRSLAHSFTGNSAQAVKDATEVIRLMPGNPSPLAWRGSAHALAKDHDKAIADYTDALKIDPKHVASLVNRGHAHTLKNSLDAALADLDEAVRLDPKRAVALFRRGQAHQRKRDFNKADADFTAAVALDPADTTYLLARAENFSYKGDRTKAIADYGAVVALDPKNLTALSSRGTLLSWRSQYDKALADFDAILKIDPKNVYAIHKRGETYGYKGEYEKALAGHTEAVRLNPKYYEGWNALGWLHATCPDAKFRDGKKAVECATKACELTQWKYGMNLDTLAAAHAEAGDFAKAVEFQKKAIEAGGLVLQDPKVKERLKLYEDKKPYRSAPVKK